MKLDIQRYRLSLDAIEQAQIASAEAWSAITDRLLSPLTEIVWNGTPALIHAWRYEEGNIVLDIRERKTQLRYIERGAVVPDLTEYMRTVSPVGGGECTETEVLTSVDDGGLNEHPGHGALIADSEEALGADADFNEFEEINAPAIGTLDMADRRQPMAIANTNKYAKSVDNGQLQRLSDSGVKAWLTCPAMWAFQYLEGIKQPSNGYFIRGRVVHDTLAYLTGEYLRTGDSPARMPIEKFVRLIDDNFTDSVQSAVRNGIDWERLSKDDALEQTKIAIKTIIESPWYIALPSHNVGHIEFDGVIDLGEVLCSCRPDIVVDDHVVDFKVANSSPNYGRIDPSHIIQNIAYCAGMGLDKTYNLYSVVGTKTPKLVVTEPVGFEESDIVRFRNMINSVAIQIKAALGARTFPATGAYTVEYGKNACVDCHYGKTGVCENALPYGGK